MRKTTRLKKLLTDKALLVAPGAYDVLSAKVIEMAGFDAVYMTGYGTSASILGEPDVGLLTMNEMVEHARNIAQAVDIPVLADGDTGYGNPLNIRRTVSEYERAGVCAIQLEDQVFPKRCGHMLGRKVIAMEEMVQKIKAATDARQDDDFVIIARTDARTSFGLEEALRRGKAYSEAGADVIFIESPENVEELKAINEAFRGTPTLANMIEGGRTPVLPAKELERSGSARHLPDRAALRRDQGGQGLHGGAEAGRDHADKVKDMIPFEDFNQLIGLPEYNRLEERYAV